MSLPIAMVIEYFLFPPPAPESSKLYFSLWQASSSVDSVYSVSKAALYLRLVQELRVKIAAFPYDLSKQITTPFYTRCYIEKGPNSTKPTAQCVTCKFQVLHFLWHRVALLCSHMNHLARFVFSVNAQIFAQMKVAKSSLLQSLLSWKTKMCVDKLNLCVYDTKHLFFCFRLKP